MPLLLQKLATLFAETAMSLESTNTDTTKTSFLPQASIVNYYNPKSIMGGHRDDLEYALDKPVVSMSMGLPAIFLLGGATKESEPVVPILVRPGDVLILGGQCRLYYHGMAKVIPNDMAWKEDTKWEAPLHSITLEQLNANDSNWEMPAEEDQRALESS